ncbi:hypothetical protein RB2150_14136 [Rhodobacteraceae bacterium HTCC2150]|jgi:16S rRNA (cytidine1402-2'-O)-methyltransferase|nr:hypothetical protein RB2150_14136 [Rhodobacteraceae bacterium HTCC2150]
MVAKHTPLDAGLYFVSTPIGAARDITLKALDILASADVLAAEDTRTARHLMDIHGIALGGRPLISYHDHNGDYARPKLIGAIKDGKSVAYVSEAGTPLVADPGYGLGVAAIQEGFEVYSAPGASAVLSALTVSGLASDRFLFAGFAPTTQSARQTFLRDFAEVPATLVFYESPKRLSKLLADMSTVFGDDRQAVVCRELTKKFEEKRRGNLAELNEELADITLKGECVVLVARGEKKAVEEGDVLDQLREALKTHRVKDAAALVAANLGMARRDVYQIALKLGRD